MMVAVSDGGDRSLPRVQRRTIGIVAVLALVAAVQRLPFVGLPPGQDEAGFFLVAHQWRDGSSLYGDLWVDRPPLLLTIFWLVPTIEWLRVVGIVAVVATLLLIASAAYVARGHRAAIAAAAVVAAYAVTPMLGAVRVNGEILAAPFVAAAILSTALMLRSEGRRALAHAAVAGAASAAAFAVKQSTIDGFVFGTLALLTVAVGERSWKRPLTLLASAAAAALATAAALVGWAAVRGTDPVDLFHAIVTFRVEAGETIRLSASPATDERLALLIVCWLASGLAVLGIAALGLAARERRDPLVVATAGTILSVSLVAMLGGSYWLHYLVQLVPATALGAALVADRWGADLRTRSGRVVAIGAVWLVLVAGISGGHALLHPLGQGPSEPTAAVIAESAHPDDTVFVAYGQPNVVWGSGLDTPYEHLWSLPIRTLDPDLRDLAALIASPEAPTWIVQWGPSFQTWGIDADRVERLVHERYVEVAEVCGRTIWLTADADRDIATPTEEC